MESKINIDKIKSKLPFGAQTKIAKKANVSVSNVNRVLNGKSEDAEILNAIADYLSELKIKQLKVNSRLASLID